jgi:hypothetical protein
MNLREVGLIPGRHLRATPLIVVTTLQIHIVLFEVHPWEDSQGLRDLEMLL